MDQASGSMAIHARCALLVDGWARNVRIEADEDGLISSVTTDTDPAPGDRRESTLIPAAVNLHSHAFQRMIVGRSERFESPDDDFWAWRSLMYRAVRELTPERLYECALDLYRDMLAAGTTTVCEFHYTHHLHRGSPRESALAIVEAARDAGIRLTLLPVLYRYGGFGRRQPAEPQRAFVLRTEACLDLIDDLRSSGQECTLRIGYAPHSLRAVDHDDIRALLDHRSATAPDAPFHIHVSEQVREVNEAMLALGTRPVAWLFDRFRPDAAWCLVHATHMDDRELAQLAASDAVVALCPTTEADLGDGIFPVGDFISAGGTIGIGSDSNITVSTAEELRLLDFQHRLLTRRRNALRLSRADAESSIRPATWLWLQALRAADRATGLPVGAIKTGRAADFVVLASEESPDDALATFVYSASTALIDRVYVGGKPYR